jgi:branched-chain amino acid transport system substrate-binding protein
MKRLLFVAPAILFLLPSCSTEPDPVVIGALYPLSGPQADGGRDEYRGVLVAAQLANEDGGIQGRQIRISSVDAPGSDAVPAAMSKLDDRGVGVVLGSYGSTISRPAASEAASRDILFWETGAVGEMAPSPGPLVFRVAPTGGVLGRSAIAFVAERFAPRLDNATRPLRYGIVNVDDAYGRSVAAGARAEIQRRGLPFAGRVSYDPYDWSMEQVVRRIAAIKADVLFVSSYLEDGVALRRTMVRRGLQLTASIGTSSSYCMPEFGAQLVSEEVGLFASDKPDAGVVDPTGLRPEGRALLSRARAAYAERFGEDMSAPALAGFSAAWALFVHVMPDASSMTPSEIAEAAREVRLPRGHLPNGSGLAFGRPGAPDGPDNTRASSVIWQWVANNRREVVWPARYATSPIKVIPIAP